MTQSRYLQPMKGFTLIELMVTVAIMGIIAIIAIPSYMDYMERARRADGYEALTSMVQSQERFYLNRYTYTTSFSALGYGTSGSVASSEGYYSMALQACGTEAVTACVQVRANVQGAQADDHDLILNTRGRKQYVDDLGFVQDGWPGGQ